MCSISKSVASHRVVEQTVRCAALIALVATFTLTACKDDTPPVKPPVKPPPPPADVKVTVTKTPVLTAHARIPQSDPNFDRAEATADGVVFHFAAKPAVDLQVDNVVAGGDGKGNTYLRKITKVVSRSDTRIEVKTKSAYITDLIGEGDFAIKMTPEASKWTLHTAPEIGGRTYALDTKINIFELFKSPKGFSCKGSVSNLSVTPILRPDVAFEISTKITPIYDPVFGVVPVSGTLEKARFVVNGSVEVGLKVTIPKKMSLTCTQDMIKWIRNLAGNPNLLALKRHAFVQIGPVPVEATIVLEPVFTVEVALESQIAEPTSADYAVKLSRLTAGLEYDGSKPQGQRNSVIFKRNTSYTKSNPFQEEVDKLTLTVSGVGLHRANLDGTGLSSIVTSDPNGISGVAVDPGGGKVYWTNYASDKVYRANLDGRGVQTIHSKSGTTYWAIAVDPSSGYIYVSDLNKIMRATLTGGGFSQYLGGLGSSIRSLAFGQ